MDDCTPCIKIPAMSSRLYIREWRNKANLTQERLADRCALSASFISRLENDKATYTKHHLEHLAEAFGCEVVDLYRDPNAREFWQVMDGLAPADRDRVLQLVRVLKSAA